MNNWRAIDFRDPSLIADPYPTLAALRRAGAVHWNDPLQAWCVFSYAQVRAAMMDARLSSDRVGPFVENVGKGDADIAYLGECIGLWMVFNDPPRHTRLRTLLNKAFLPQAVDALRPVIAAQTDRLLDQLLQQGTRADFVRDFAYPLPANVIADMLGVHSDQVDNFKRWSNDIARFVLSAPSDPGKYQRAAQSLRELNAYFAEVVKERRRQPGEKIIDRLIEAHEGEDLLSLDELLASCVLLLFAGHETTTHFFSSGLRALWSHRDQWQRLRANAGNVGYVKNTVQEILRWDGPVFATSRIANQPLQLGDQAIAAGERVFLFLGAANHDEQMFEDAAQFDIERADARKMITFGQGIHTCLGIHLAMLEGEEAWPRITAALDGWDFDAGEVKFTEHLVVRGATVLPIHRR